MLRGSRVQVQERLAVPSPHLGSGFPDVQGVWESWEWDELYYGNGGATGGWRRIKQDAGLREGAVFSH